MLFGLFHLSIWGYIAVILVLTQITVAAVTIYLHRGQTHRALDLHPVVSHFFRFWLWLTTGMKTKSWVAIHRKHHAKCETMEDPHSPQILGIKKVFFEGAELYREASKDKEAIEKYGHGTPDDWIERHLYTPHDRIGLALMFFIDIALFGVVGITVWAMQLLWIPVFAAGVINGIGHYWGYRNYECEDASRNVMPWTFLACGEELHNNHHTFPTSAKLSVKPWEFDMGWFYIRCLQIFNLVKVKRLPPELLKKPAKLQIDLDTVKAVVTNRFQVLANYTREVLLPVLQEEQRKAKRTSCRLLERAKVLLTRADSLLDEKSRQRMSQLLEKYQNLRLVYQFKQRLQAIWGRTTANHRELIEALQQWCKEAEATGISVLKNFAIQLKAYSATAA